jgi:hypothetical protein
VGIHAGTLSLWWEKVGKSILTRDEATPPTRAELETSDGKSGEHYGIKHDDE